MSVSEKTSISCPAYQRLSHLLLTVPVEVVSFVMYYYEKMFILDCLRT